VAIPALPGLGKFFLLGAVISTLMITYGSLLPFEIRHKSFSQALDIFLNMKYYMLGVSSRADLVANAIIYIPASLLWMGSLDYLNYFKYKRSKTISVLLLLFAWSLLIEFIQIFISPRTVSVNDLIAEATGIAIGVTVWNTFGQRIKSHLMELKKRKYFSIQSLLLLSILGVTVYSLMPFDFYIRPSEVKSALATRGIPFFPSSRGQDLFSLRNVFIYSAESAVAMLLGFLAFRSNVFRSITQPKLLAISFLYFSGLELLQFFEYSGHSSIILAAIKTAGFSLGVTLSGKLVVTRLLNHANLLRKFAILSSPLYIFLVLYLKGWGVSPNFNPEKIIQTLQNVSYFPFYYHYFTSEVGALKSLLFQASLTLPLGFYIWFKDKTYHSYSKLSLIVTIGFLASFFLEMGGLLWSGLRPDFTNILIVGLSLPATYYFTNLMFETLSRSDKNSQEEYSAPMAEFVDVVHHDRISPPIKSSVKGLTMRLFSAIALISALLFLMDYPLSRLLIGFLGLGYTLLLFYKPHIWLYVIPATLPLMDLYPLSGRFFFTEFDFFILLTVAAKYFQGHLRLEGFISDRPLCFLLSFIALTYVISLSILLIPPPTIDITSFTSFYSPYNALRLSKPVLWLLLLIPVLKYELANDDLSYDRICIGMIFGLLALCFVVLVERQLFTGLLNLLNTQHRVRGSFSSMHTGGSHIDVYLVTTLPFLIVPLLSKLNKARLLIFTISLLVTFYCIFVTYSRGPYLISGISVLLLALGFWFTSRGRIGSTITLIIGIFSFVVLVAWISVPFSFNSFLSTRMGLIEQDKDTRLNHWKRTIGLVDRDLVSQLWGEGPGTFPYNLVLDNLGTGRRTAQHELNQEYGNVYLTLVSGSNIYTNQYISVDPSANYQFSFRYRSSEMKAQLVFPVCEKWIADSFRCQWNSTKLPQTEEWKQVKKAMPMDAFIEPLGRLGVLSSRPKTFSIHVITEGHVDLDDLKILNDKAENILRNGDFFRKKDYWYFTADSHLEWHTKNLFINLYHDLGWMGLVSISSLILMTLFRLILMIRTGDHMAVVLFASLFGYIGIGLIGSLMDVPQLSLLLFLILMISNMKWQESNTGSAQRYH